MGIYFSNNCYHSQFCERLKERKNKDIEGVREAEKRLLRILTKRSP